MEPFRLAITPAGLVRDASNDLALLGFTALNGISAEAAHRHSDCVDSSLSVWTAGGVLLSKTTVQRDHSAIPGTKSHEASGCR